MTTTPAAADGTPRRGKRERRRRENEEETEKEVLANHEYQMEYVDGDRSAAMDEIDNIPSGGRGGTSTESDFPLPWEGEDGHDDAFNNGVGERQESYRGNPYHNAATLLAGDDVSIASSSDFTLANINLASKVPGKIHPHHATIHSLDGKEYGDGEDSNSSSEHYNGGKNKGLCGTRRRVCMRASFLFVMLAFAAGTALLTSQFLRPGENTKVSSFAMHQGTTEGGGEGLDKLIPTQYANLSNTIDPPHDGSLPFLWDLPGDGDVYQRIITGCLGLTAAGGQIGDPRQTDVGDDEPLEVFKGEDFGHYVNVFLGDMRGIQRAEKLNLAGQSDLADVVYSPLIYEASTIFSADNPGRMFALLHHPVHRVASIHHIVKSVNPQYHSTSLGDWLKVPMGADNNNWMTRELAGGIDGSLNEEHFQRAREVLRSKCLVGLTSSLEESIDMMQTYFGWKNGGDQDRVEGCIESVTKTKKLDRIYFDLVQEHSEVWNTTAELNKYDMRLYEVAEMLFAEQKKEGVKSHAPSSSSVPRGATSSSSSSKTCPSRYGIAFSAIMASTVGLAALQDLTNGFTD